MMMMYAHILSTHTPPYTIYQTPRARIQQMTNISGTKVCPICSEPVSTGEGGHSDSTISQRAEENGGTDGPGSTVAHEECFEALSTQEMVEKSVYAQRVTSALKVTGIVYVNDSNGGNDTPSYVQVICM